MSTQEKTAFSALKVTSIPVLESSFGSRIPFRIAVKNLQEKIKYEGLTLRVKHMGKGPDKVQLTSSVVSQEIKSQLRLL